MKEQSFEFDVNDFLLVPKSIMRDVLELYTPDHFHAEIRGRSFEANILFKRAFNRGESYTCELLNADMLSSKQSEELLSKHYTEKFNTP
jgi:hypothetical protein